MGIGRGEHDRGANALVPVHLFRPPSLVFPAHYSFLFFPFSFPVSPPPFVYFLLLNG